MWLVCYVEFFCSKILGRNFQLIFNYTRNSHSHKSIWNNNLYKKIKKKDRKKIVDTESEEALMKKWVHLLRGIWATSWNSRTLTVSLSSCHRKKSSKLSFKNTCRRWKNTGLQTDWCQSKVAKTAILCTVLRAWVSQRCPSLGQAVFFTNEVVIHFWKLFMEKPQGCLIMANKIVL